MANNEEIHPVTGEPMDNAPWERLVSALASTGVFGNPGGPELQAYRTAAGLFVRPGTAVVRGHVFYRPASDGDRQLTVTPNAGGSTRLDLVTLRLNPLANPILDLVVITGGAAAPSPTRTETGILDVPIAITSVPSGSNVPSIVTDFREFAGTDIIPCRAAPDVPAERRRIGTCVFETTTSMVRFWTGTAWITLQQNPHTHAAVDTGWITAPLIRNWQHYGGPFNVITRFRRLNGVVFLDGFCKFGFYGTVFVLPEGFRPSQWTLVTVTYAGDGNNKIGRVDINPTGEVNFHNIQTANTGNTIDHLSVNTSYPV